MLPRLVFGVGEDRRKKTTEKGSDGRRGRTLRLSGCPGFVRSRVGVLSIPFVGVLGSRQPRNGPVPEEVSRTGG